LELERIYCNW